MSETILSTIRDSQLFSHLSEDQLNLVAQGATLLDIDGEHVLIEEGSKVESLFVIVSGTVEVFTNALGRHVDLTKLSAGAYVGEVSLLSGKTATATVRTLEPAQIVAIDRETIVKMVDQDETLRKTLEGVTLARAKDTLGKVLQ